MAIFDREASSYDDWFDTALGKYADYVETELLLKLLQPKRGMRILDVGCGTGNISIKLAKLGCQVVGIDISTSMLEKAHLNAQKAGVDVTFLNQDIFDYESAEAFDGICSNTAFEFIKEKKQGVEKMLHLLKKGGSLVIGTIQKESLWYDFYMERLASNDQYFSVFKYADFLTKEALSQLSLPFFKKVEEAVFVAPTVPEGTVEEYIEMERNPRKDIRGGFVCGLWIKE